MKEYKTIDYYGDYWGLPIIAFDKLDGNNLRFEYSPKRGFYKFGTRNMIIDESNLEFGFAINIFLDKYSEPLTKIFKSKNYRDIQSITCFAELVGEKSEFGKHFLDDILDTVLFDVELDKKGLIPPREFIKEFEKVGIPNIVYEGNLNKEFVKSVKENEYNLREGVIGKGIIPNQRNKLYYCKIKTNDWFDRLRANSLEDYEKELKQSYRK